MDEHAAVARIELLNVVEGATFGATGDAEADLLGITAVHPMGKAQVRTLLAKEGADESVLERLLDEGRLGRIPYAGEVFFVRVR